MKKTIPFTKDITFKTKIGEITSISLDNDLMLKGEDLISGNFYISGSYKMLETSTILEEYSYKIPCEIGISEEYDTFDSSIDIDDFYYEIIDDEILRINIVVAIDNLKKKEKEEKREEKVLEDKDETELLDENRCIEEEIEKPNISFLEVKEKVKKETDNYLTYKVYIFKDGDSIEDLLEKYKITKEDLENYNNLEDIVPGVKLVIPSINA